MSIPVLGAPSQIAKSEVIRRTVNFHPDIWGDRFINNISKDKVTCLFAMLVCKDYVVKLFIIFVVFIYLLQYDY